MNTTVDPDSRLCDLCCKTTYGPTAFAVEYNGKTYHLTCALLSVFKGSRSVIGKPREKYRPDIHDKPPPPPEPPKSSNGDSDFHPHSL